MPIPRLKANVLQAIYRQSTNTQIRCLRTKPTHILPPLQSAFGLPSIDNIRKRVGRRMRRKADKDKIPIVPKIGDDETPIVPAIQKPRIKRKVSREELTPEELAEEKSLREQERRISEYERDRKYFEGMNELDKQRALAKEREQEKMIERPDNTVYPRDVIGRRFKKEKVKYKVEVYRTKNYIGFLAVPNNRKRMAQAAAEITQEYHRHMNGDKLEEMLSAHAATTAELPADIVLENIDPRHLELPFPPEAILPAMRLVFESMKNQIRFAFTDQQINSISTGADFIKHLLNPPKPVTNPNPPTFLHTQLTQIQFPLNVKVLPDKQFERRKRDELNAIKARQAKIKQQKKEAELIQLIHKERVERRKRIVKQREEAKRLIREQEEAKLEGEQRQNENYSQFYGRIK